MKLDKYELLYMNKYELVGLYKLSKCGAAVVLGVAVKLSTLSGVHVSVKLECLTTSWITLQPLGAESEGASMLMSNFHLPSSLRFAWTKIFVVYKIVVGKETKVEVA